MLCVCFFVSTQHISCVFLCVCVFEFSKKHNNPDNDCTCRCDSFATLSASGNHLAPINMAPTSSSSQPDLLLQSFTPNESPPVTYPPTPVRSSNNSGAEDNSGEKM